MKERKIFEWLLLLALVFLAGIFRSASPSAAMALPDQITEENGIKRLGPAWLMKKNGVYLLHVQGSDYEMAYQHGALLREEIHQGMFAFMAGYFRREIEHSMIGGSPVLVNLAEWFMNNAVFDRVAAGIPPEAEAALRGLAKGAGYKYETMRRLMVFADAAQVIEGLVYGQQKNYPGLRPFATFACSSFAASGPATTNGHLLHGRNLDFPGQGWFDRFPTVVFCQPASGQRYLMITTAGLHSAGVTGMNESGLALGIHTAVTADVGLSGWPVIPLAEKVIREATNLEQAIAILKKNRPAAGWIIMVSEASTGRAVLVEISHSHAEVIPMQDHLLATSNSYRTPVMTKDEINVNWSYPINSLSRLKRLYQLLNENHGQIDPQKAAEFLGDHHDVNTGAERATGDVIAQFHNIQSVVMDVTEKNFWLALGPAPVCNSKFVGFNFEDGFTGNFRDLPELHGAWEKEPRLPGLHLYIRASHRYSWEDRPDLAVQDVEEALRLDPAEPVYAQVLGLIYLKSGKPALAAETFPKALVIRQYPYKEALSRLWLARAYDLLGQRDQAREQYTKVLTLSPLDSRVLASARKGLQKPFTPNEAKKISIDFGSGDSYDY